MTQFALECYSDTGHKINYSTWRIFVNNSIYVSVSSQLHWVLCSLFIIFCYTNMNLKFTSYIAQYFHKPYIIYIYKYSSLCHACHKKDITVSIIQIIKLQNLAVMLIPHL